MVNRLATRRTAAFFSLLGSVFAVQADTAVFINEIHYDNAGTDINEQIEIAAPAGTDLTGWHLVAYNGSDGLGYADVALTSGAFSTCGNATLVVVPVLGLQNGGQDGVALVDGGGDVVQFLSYEGTFAANDGPASGMLSVDMGVSEPGTSPADQSLQLGGNGNLYSAFVWHAPATATFGTCNVGQTFAFGPPVDIAPSVLSTTPVNAMAGVPTNANVAVTFSEAVDLGATWYEILCSISGTHSGVVTGGGAAYVINPATDFDAGESCTVTVNATQVVDADGDTADAMAADYEFSFTTAGDLPPSLTMTKPANDAANVARAGNLQVTFSEPVTLDAGWYTVSCGSSGAHTAAQSGGGAVYTLNPEIDFAALEPCTWTIFGDHVHDLDGAIHAMVGNAVVTFQTGADNDDYYAGVDTSSGAALKAWLHNRIKDHHTVPYSGGTANTWTVLEAADEDPANPDNTLDIYLNRSYVKVAARDDGQAHPPFTVYNREHTWPKSLGFPDSTRPGTGGSKPNPPHVDGHMLHASEKDYNTQRGNKPFADCLSGCTRLQTEAYGGFGGGAGHGDSNWVKGPDGNAGSFEVWDKLKGDMARSVMYMAVRYKGGVNSDGVTEPNLELTDNRSQIVLVNAQNTPGGGTAYMGLLTDLLDWNDFDPPDAVERIRNDVVYALQGNRNPFVDHPEWTRCVFTGVTCPVQDDVIFADGFE